MTCLNKGEADLAITEVSEFNIYSDEMVSLTTVPIIPVASKNHPLVIVDRKLKVEDLQEHVHIIMKSTVKDSEHIKNTVSEDALTWSVTDYLTKKKLLLSGLS